MIQEIPFAGWKRNLRLGGKTTELVITLDVGPRILRYGLHDERNVFLEMQEELGHSGEKDWMNRGGHRFWTAPEADHSYEPDNGPVDWKKVGEDAVEIIQPESRYGFHKTLRVELGADEVVRVSHSLKNLSDKPLAYTPWALSVMPPGGAAFIPQPRLDFHPSEFPEGRATKPEDYLPNRELILWPFTNLTDGRFVFTEHFLQVSHHPERPATKIGLKLATGWVGYQKGDLVFAKHFAYDPTLPYPDRGANFELYTDRGILELESLAPAMPLAPGATREHIEHWVVRKTANDLRRGNLAKEFFDALPKIG